MKLWPFSRSEEKRSRALVLDVVTTGKPVWSGNHFRAYAEEGYSANVVVNSAINRIANAVATIDWRVRLGKEVLTEHPFIDLMKRPNPMQSKAEWWRTRISYLLLHGNSYIERILLNKEVKELWILRPDRMMIVPGESGIPRSFIYKVGKNEVIFRVDETTGDSDVQHTKLFNPLDDWYGQSPLAPGAFAVDQHNAAMGWVQALLQNSARPSGALVLNAESSLSDDEFNRLRHEIETQYAGARNAGRPMLLEGGLDWKQMGFSPDDMGIGAIKDSAARDISLAFGVPPLLLNIPGDNTYSNYREARLGFYEDTIIPFLTYEVEELNAWLSPFFGGAVLEPILETVEALAEKRMKLWEMADKSDDLTLNESRALKGLPPMPEPLGSTLMTEIRSARPDPAQLPVDEQIMKEFVYGKDR